MKTLIASSALCAFIGMPATAEELRLEVLEREIEYSPYFSPLI